MASAYIIQHHDRTAGIVVVERSGVRFYASDYAFASLDNQVFKNIRAVHNAVAEKRRAESARTRSAEAIAA